MSNIDKQALLIENGQLVADTLRHLADNEVDSDYFAVTSTSENGTETEYELAITDYALQAAGTVDELVRALEAAEKRAEAAEKRTAELEAMCEVFLRAKALMYQSGGAPIENSLNPIDAWLYDAERATMLQGSQPVSNRDELPVTEIECDICGFKSTDPDGAHYCCEDNSND